MQQEQAAADAQEKRAKETHTKKMAVEKRTGTINGSKRRRTG